MRSVSETSGALNTPTMALWGSQKELERPEKISEDIIAENFPNTRKETLKSKKHRVPYKINPKRKRMRHILIKLKKIKDQEKLLKAQEKSNK